MEEKYTPSTRLVDEVASVTTPQTSRSLSVQLIDINILGVRFLAQEQLIYPLNEPLSMRFTLPGQPRLHFTMITLPRPGTRKSSGYCYDADFVRTDPQTIEHIMHYQNLATPRTGKDATTLYLS